MDNRNILISANRALLDGNFEQFISYCTDDIRWENVGENIFNGKAELLGYVSSAYDGVTFTTENYIQNNDTVVELGQIEFKKDSGSEKSSYCDIWSFKDGLISELRSFVIAQTP
ncbi:nuclear transport factor 2 family protein [Pedobacter psychrodurus]|uniref:Nuclear transport factor 2 family protein n=1 Tax=Pedobacter psychrodurus TaxID=2530456 RepID=A0A4R0Q177_9SPHI|nr:nuclear transport factor 2 family protein [Pedobacter psychrodurus]TCD28726.1 nuclear transport factor 2 family protein [Pedobacter psychrodurus]